MNCNELPPLREAYLDSELDPKTSLEVAGHLNTCAACARTFEADHRFAARLHIALGTGMKTPDLWTRLEAQARQALSETGASADSQCNAPAGSQRHAAASAGFADFWRALLWPCPRFYVGLAALWMILLAADWGGRDPATGPSASTAQAPALAENRAESRPTTRAGLGQRRRDIAALLAALDGAPDEPVVPQPRSQAPGRRMAG